MHVIIFPTDDNRVVILSPAPEMDIAEVAAKDVPEGKPFRIINAADLPDAPQDAWAWTGAGPLNVVTVAPSASPLLPSQWSFLLDLTGFRASIDTALAMLPKATLEERKVWAALKADAYASQRYRQDVTLALAAKLRAMGVPVPTDADILEAWPEAASYDGAAAVMGTDAV